MTTKGMAYKGKREYCSNCNDNGAVSEALTLDFSSVTGKDVFLVILLSSGVSVVAVLLINQSAKVLSGGATAVFTAFMPVSAIWRKDPLVSFGWHCVCTI